MRRSVIGLVPLLAIGAIGGCEPAADGHVPAEARAVDPAGQNRLTPEEQAEGWVLLFDGRTLDGWTNRGVAEWRVEGGTITSVAGTGEGHLASNRSFGDFRLHLDFWIDETANSGIYFRVPESEPATTSNSFEVQIFDAGPVWQTGAVIEIQPVTVQPHTAGQWNTYDITADGNHFIVLLNGEKVVDTIAPPRLPSGPIILAPIETGELHFRNIRVLPL